MYSWLRTNKKASAILNLLVLTMCLNTFAYLSLNFTYTALPTDDTAVKLQGDFFDIYLKDKVGFDSDMALYAQGLRNGSNISKSVNVEPEDIWASLPSQEAGQPISAGDNNFAFLDGLRIVYGFFATLINVVILPITLFTASILPPLLVLMIGIPLSMLMMVTIIGFIGGRLAGG